MSKDSFSLFIHSSLFIGSSNFPSFTIFLYIFSPALIFTIYLFQIKSEDHSYNVILEISSPTLYSNQLNEQNGEKNHPSNEYFENVGRILEYGGRYLYVTNAAESTVESILSYFKDSWFIRAQEVEINIKLHETHDVYSPLFMFVMTKLKMKCKYCIHQNHLEIPVISWINF